MNALLTALGVVLSAGIAGLISLYTQRKASALGARKENREDFAAITERLSRTRLPVPLGCGWLR